MLVVASAHLNGFGTGIVLPPPPPTDLYTSPQGDWVPVPPKTLHIHARDSILVNDSTDAKSSPPIGLTEGELRPYLRELDELSKRLQQATLEWSRENPVLAPVVIFILCQVIIQLIDALFE